MFYEDPILIPYYKNGWNWGQIFGLIKCSPNAHCLLIKVFIYNPRNPGWKETRPTRVDLGNPEINDRRYFGYFIYVFFYFYENIAAAFFKYFR